MKKLIEYVNMRYGTNSDETCAFIGPCRPNSSIAPGPDSFPRSYSTGYLCDKPLRGFSQLHMQAGGPRFLNFLLSPQVGLSTELGSHDSEKGNEIPTVAEYSVTLKKYGINVSFAPTEHSVMYRLKYPETSEASIVLDMLNAYGKPDDITISIGEDERGNMTLFGGLYNGQNPRHHIYFYAVLGKKPSRFGTYVADRIYEGRKTHHIETLSTVAMQAKGMGAYAMFDTKAGETVNFKLAISFKSSEQAKAWLESEIPAWDYDGIKARTEELWEEKLSKIKISENTPEVTKMMFYTMLHDCYVNPRDRKGDFKQYDDSVDMIDDHLCTWDTFRTLYPLYTILEPEFVAKTVRSYVTRLDTNECVRDMLLGGVERDRNQGGDNVDVIIAEAFAKKIDGVDWQEAYRVLRDNAESWRDDQCNWGFPVKNVPSTYRDLGYLPADAHYYPDIKDGRLCTETWVMGCTKALEYAYNDYCCASVAKGLSEDESIPAEKRAEYAADYEKYIKRSENWKKLWNKDAEGGGYRGFIWPRYGDGRWVEGGKGFKNPYGQLFEDATSWNGSWNGYFYEGRAYEYSFFVPHDIETLKEYMGGDDEFCDRIEKGLENHWIWPGNQPGLHQAFLPSLTKTPWRTTECVDIHIKRYTEIGMPFCDDSGCMCAWWLFAMLGFYPNAGQEYYMITSPRLESAVIDLGAGKFSIKAENFGGDNRYIQSITLNGTPYKSTVLHHSDIVQGGELVFVMGKDKVNYAE